MRFVQSGIVPAGRVGLLGLAALTTATVAPAQDPAPGKVRTDSIPGTDVVFSMVRVPGGELQITSSDETERGDDEDTPSPVRIAPFWMGVHEVTHDEFDVFRNRWLDDHVGPGPQASFDADAISRPSPPYEDPAHGMRKAGHPAVGMTRWSALHYARWLSLKTGRLYRLPTEAEWEHACRAGGDGPYGFGDDPGTLPEHAWFADNGEGTYHEVGRKAASSFGLHDMHGNVAEWVLDDYDPDGLAAPDSGAAAGVVVTAGGRGVVRGGSFADPPARLRCAARTPEAAAWKRRDPQIPRSRWWNTDAPHVGFRLVSPEGAHTTEEIDAYWDALLGE